jgi:plastocyanin
MRRLLTVILFTLSGSAPIVLAHPQPAGAAPYTITINGAPNCGASKFCYSPSSLTVTAGDAVTWVNNSAVPHTVTGCVPSTCFGSGTARGGRQNGLSSPTIEANGGTFTFTFTRPGKYKYFSAIHGHAMLPGKITVVAATTTTSASTTSTTAPSPSTATAGTRASAIRQLTGAFTYTVAIDGTPNCGTSMFCYNPSSLAVNVGDTVTWVNDSTTPQTITRCDSSTCSGNGPGSGGQSGPFSPTINASGGAFSFTFTDPGTYNYFCVIDGCAMMNGEITVDPDTRLTTAGMDSTTAGPSSTTVQTIELLSAASRPTSSSSGAASNPLSANQLAGNGNPMSQGVAIGLVLLLLGLGLAAASTARRRSNSERPRIDAPESPLTMRLLQEFEAKGSIQDPP